MARDIFTWYPDAGAVETTTPNVAVTKFGDGYETRLAKGINAVPAKWALTFTKTMSEALAIRSFLVLKAGTISFTWTTPLNETATWVCRNWKLTRDRGTTQVTCDFEQVYEI
jgi:phage-related protein